MYIFHLGISGFPGNSAPIQRIQLTFKGLKLTGLKTLIINKESITSKKFHRVERINGIPVIFTSLNTKRPDSFIWRNINKLTGVFGEIVFLIKIRKKLHTAILYTPSFIELIYYRIISKLLGFNIIIQYVELRSSIEERNTFFKKINDKLFDTKFYLFCDGVIAISEFLLKHVNNKSCSLPVIKIPAMCDFAQFDSIKSLKEFSYLMYCGTIAYSEVIEFIIEVFHNLKVKTIYNGQLMLVISGKNDNNWLKIKNIIKEFNLELQVIIKSNISYNDLLSLYSGADVLLIPLRDTVQDTARFPHKIGEYTASGRPILSTNVGELKIYFKDGISAILADGFAVNSYVEKLDEILLEKSKLDCIGKSGYKIGINHFDYHAQTQHLKQFILNI